MTIYSKRTTYLKTCYLSFHLLKLEAGEAVHFMVQFRNLLLNLSSGNIASIAVINKSNKEKIKLQLTRKVCVVFGRESGNTEILSRWAARLKSNKEEVL